MKFSRTLALALCAAALPATMLADDDDRRPTNGCSKLPSHAQLLTALKAATTTETTGLDLQMWGTIVDRDGVVCAVAFTGTDRGAQWPGSRVISAQKANTANAFSLNGLALSTANLYSATQPGSSLYGLQESNPVSTDVAYRGNSADNGTAKDPMVGGKIGGVNVFGGGLALCDASRKVIGAVGVSGDTSCADHRIGWRVRDSLNLDNLAGLFAIADAAHPDNMVLDITDNPNGGTGKSAGGFGHPSCINTGVPNTLPAVQ